MTEKQVTTKYYDIEDKIPSVYDSWETVGVNLSRDIANLEDIISVELIRVISILNNRKIVDLTHKIKREFMVLGLYPEKQKALNIFPDRLSVTIDKKDIRETGDVWQEFYQCPNCKEIWVVSRNKFCGDCGSLINWK
jgi:transcription initiation factor IIE alpha subunit